MDYETQSVHHLLLRAADPVSGGSSEIPLEIRVRDANDNPPVFIGARRGIYNFTLSELVSPGRVVARVRAKDMDSGEKNIMMKEPF